MCTPVRNTWPVAPVPRAALGRAPTLGFRRTEFYKHTRAARPVAVLSEGNNRNVCTAPIPVDPPPNYQSKYAVFGFFSPPELSGIGLHFKNSPGFPQSVPFEESYQGGITWVSGEALISLVWQGYSQRFELWMYFAYGYGEHLMNIKAIKSINGEFPNGVSGTEGEVVVSEWSGVVAGSYVKVVDFNLTEF